MKEKDSSCVAVGVGAHVFTAGVHRFAHPAMATLFEVYCAHPDARYAGQAAQAAFDLVDRLEQELSRFIENSDIARINSLESGQSAGVSPSTLECLQTARRMYIETEGAFDISIGSGFENLEFLAGDMVVHALAAGARLDLGGIGKGYAVDRIAEVMEEWEIAQALIHGGFSSVLALEPPPTGDGWPLTLRLPGAGKNEVLTRVSARRLALSASGVQKGDHIIDPRRGLPVDGRLAAWVSVPRAVVPPWETDRSSECAGMGRSASAFAEALSTAFMILSTAEVEACSERWPGLEAWLVPKPAQDESRAPIFLHFPDS